MFEIYNKKKDKNIIKQKYKYIHILCTKVFSVRLVHLINSNPTLYPKDHLFITANNEIAKELRNYNNVILDDRYGLFNRVALVNKYAPRCDWLFLHSIPIKQAFLIKRCYLSKIIWRVWGHDNGYHTKTHEPFRNVVKTLINKAYLKIIKRYALIGVANLVDIIDLESIHGKMNGIKFLSMPYSSGLNYEVLQEKSVVIPSHDGINIMIGHSGNRTDNHLKILESLTHLCSENIRLFLPLSYGDKDYISIVSQKANSLFGGKVVIIKDYMEYSDYLSFIHKMDVVVLGATGSAGLGNASLAVNFNKTIVLAENGVIARAFEREQLPFIKLSDLQSISYKRLKSISFSYDGKRTDLFLSDPQSGVKKWKQVLTYLDSLDSSL